LAFFSPKNFRDETGNIADKKLHNVDTAILDLDNYRSRKYYPTQPSNSFDDATLVARNASINENFFI
jgi:hypothetical protein